MLTIICAILGIWGTAIIVFSMCSLFVEVANLPWADKPANNFARQHGVQGDPANGWNMGPPHETLARNSLSGGNDARAENSARKSVDEWKTR